MIKAKVKIKASGQHAQDLLGQLPGMGDVKPQVQVQTPAKKKPLPSRKGGN